MITETTARASQLAGLSLTAASLMAIPLDHNGIALIGMLSAQTASIVIALIRALGDAKERREERAEREERRERALQRAAMRATYPQPRDFTTFAAYTGAVAARQAADAQTANTPR